MANPVNYTVTNTPLVVNTNSTINQASDNFIKMTLTPSLGFTLTKEDLTIGGTTGTNWEENNLPDVDSGVEVSAWDDGSFTGVVTALPIGVTKVLMFNLNNTVMVYAYLDPNYSISNENINIVLDIDGDAVAIPVPPIPTPPTPPTPAQMGSFTISVRLQQNSGASVYAITPSGSPYQGVSWNYNSNYSINAYNPLSSLLVASGITGSDKATLLCTPNYSTTQNQTLMSNPINLAGENQAWFWIVPNEGYTVSRDSFYPDTGVSVSDEPINNTVNETTSIYTGPLFGFYCTSGVPDQLISNSQESIIQAGVYGGTTAGSAATGYNDVIAYYGSEQTSISNIYGNSTSPTEYGSSELLLIDSSSTSIGSSNLVYPFNIDGQDFINGVMPSVYCPSDWAGNGVLVALNGIKSMIPGFNPSDIIIDIYGQAMLDDGSQCADVTINIEEPE